MRGRDLADQLVHKELESPKDAVHGFCEKSISYEEAVKREVEYRKLINIRGLPLQPTTVSESLPAFPQVKNSIIYFISSIMLWYSFLVDIYFIRYHSSFLF